ncbi:ribose 5-phosphate isomerase B [bacterium]|nr:ribose 5-phosphate isomerase B [bacterium]
MKIGIGSDHAGFSHKEAIKIYLEGKGFEVKDYGTYSEDSADYPDFAHPVAAAVNDHEFEKAILVCGSGQGVCMTANKYPGVRAALVWNAEVAKLTRQHNDSNIICIPGRMIDIEEAKRAVDAFFATEFEGGRHQRRVNKIQEVRGEKSE